MGFSHIRIIQFKNIQNVVRIIESKWRYFKNVRARERW